MSIFRTALRLALAMCAGLDHSVGRSWRGVTNSPATTFTIVIKPPRGRLSQQCDPLHKLLWADLLYRWQVLLLQLSWQWQQTCEMSLKSWLTSIIPPSKSLIASARASIVSMSRWLVGSSSSNRWGRCQASHAKMTRQRWPSDRLPIGHVWQQSINQSINQSISQPINLSINQSINQSVSQSVNQSINQSVSQSINQSFK